MKRIVFNLMFFVLLIAPLMSLNSAKKVSFSTYQIRQQNDTLRKEIKKIEYEIKVVDKQTKYKDSIDAVRDSLRDTSGK